MASGFGELIYSEDVTGPMAAKKETHLPRIEAPERVKKGEVFQVKVRVGPHPNEPGHSIRRVELWFAEEGRQFNPVHIATVILEPGYAEPEIVFSVKLEKSGVIYALAYCNLHGVWEARREVKVE